MDQCSTGLENVSFVLSVDRVSALYTHTLLKYDRVNGKIRVTDNVLKSYRKGRLNHYIVLCVLICEIRDE